MGNKSIFTAPVTDVDVIPSKKIHNQLQAHVLSPSRPQSSSSEFPRHNIQLVDNSQNITDTINVWLNDQSNHEFERPQTSKRKRKRKRRVPDQTFSKQSQIRQQLMAVSGNNIKSIKQSPGRNLRSFTQNAPRAIPTRDGRSKKTVQQSNTADYVIDPLDLVEQKGKSKLRPSVMGEIPFVQKRFQNLQYNGQTSDSNDSRDSKKQKSQSPTKHLGDFQFSDMPVDSRGLGLQPRYRQN